MTETFPMLTYEKQMDTANDDTWIQNRDTVCDCAMEPVGKGPHGSVHGGDMKTPWRPSTSGHQALEP